MVDEEILAKIALGLYEVAKTNKVEGVYREDLKFFAWVIEKDPKLAEFLNSPFSDYAAKCKVMDGLLGDLLVPEVMAFAKILVRDRLIPYLDRIRQEYNRLADEEANIVEGVIYSPFDLETGTVNTIERIFGRKTGKKVILKQYIDKTLLGGVKVLIDGVVYEYSIGSQLAAVQKKLTSSNQ